VNIPKLLSMKEVAKALAVHPAKAYELAATGQIRCYRPCKRSVRISEADLVEYIKSVQVCTVMDRKRVQKFHDQIQK
jgi:excisionase family DNA binding protein